MNAQLKTALFALPMILLFACGSSSEEARLQKENQELKKDRTLLLDQMKVDSALASHKITQLEEQFAASQKCIQEMDTAYAHATDAVISETTKDPLAASNGIWLSMRIQTASIAYEKACGESFDRMNKAIAEAEVAALNKNATIAEANASQSSTP